MFLMVDWVRESRQRFLIGRYAAHAGTLYRAGGYSVGEVHGVVRISGPVQLHDECSGEHIAGPGGIDLTGRIARERSRLVLRLEQQRSGGPASDHQERHGTSPVGY